SSRLFVSTLPRPPSPTLFPYTTLFRSLPRERRGVRGPRGARADRLGHRRHAPPALPRVRARLLRDLLHRPRRRAARDHELPRERSEEHTSELQSLTNLVCRLLLEKKKH